MAWLGIIIVVLMLVVFSHCVEKVKFGEFEDRSLWLMPFGIYNWGQGLVLAPFWLLFGICCIFWWNPNNALTGYVWFQVVRAVTEIAMVKQDGYTGLAEMIIPPSDKVSKTQSVYLYLLSLSLVIIGGGYFLAMF